MKKQMHKVGRQLGSAVVMLAVVLMVAAAFVISPGLWATGTMMKTGLDAHNRTRAYYAARSGISDVFYKLKTSGYTFSPYTMGSLNGMTVAVSLVPGTSPIVAGTKTTYYLQSTAALSGSTLSTVYAQVDVDRSGGYPFQYAIGATDGGITAGDSASNVNIISHPVDGTADIYSENGFLHVSGSVHGTGYYYNPTGSNSGCSNIIGTPGGCQSAGKVTFQTLNETWYLNQAMLGSTWNNSPPTHSESILTISNTRTLGGAGYTSYINGNLDIAKKSNVTVNGVVWVNGRIVIRNGASLTTNPSQQCYLLAHGAMGDNHYIYAEQNSTIVSYDNLNLISDNSTITFENNVKGTTINLGFLYAPNGDISVGPGSNLSIAAMLGKSVMLRNNITVNYDTDLRNNPPEGFQLNVTTTTISGFSGQ